MLILPTYNLNFTLLILESDFKTMMITTYTILLIKKIEGIDWCLDI
jgi:hypothetical protein